jgi:hypothetical protein
MSTGAGLFFPLVIIAGIVSIFYYKFYKKKKQDEIDLLLILENLERSIKYNDAMSVLKYGKELMYNRFLTNRHLEDLKPKLEENFKDDESVDELRFLIRDKQKHWAGIFVDPY